MRRAALDRLRDRCSLDQVAANARSNVSRHHDRQTPPDAGGERAGTAVAGGPRDGRTDRNAVPEQRLLLRAPLALEAVGPGVPGRPPEIEARESVRAGGLDRFPVEKHVRTEREM